MVRWGVLVSTALLIGGCATVSVPSLSGGQYYGQPVGRLVAKFGPPLRVFRLPDGSIVHEWTLVRRSDTEGQNRCHIYVTTDPGGAIQSVSTETSSGGECGSAL
jgi:hypothetical protein